MARVTVRRGYTQSAFGDSFRGWYAFESETPEYSYTGDDLSPMLLRWVASVRRQIEARIDADAEKLGTFAPDFAEFMRWDLFIRATGERDKATGEPDFSQSFEAKPYSPNYRLAAGWETLEDAVRAIGANEHERGGRHAVTLGGSTFIAAVIKKVVIRVYTVDLRSFVGSKDKAWNFFSTAQDRRNKEKLEAIERTKRDRAMADDIIAKAKKEAEAILNEAREKAQAILNAAKERAAEVKARAQKILDRAERKSDKILAEAKEIAEALREGRRKSTRKSPKKTTKRKPRKGK